MIDEYFVDGQAVRKEIYCRSTDIPNLQTTHLLTGCYAYCVDTEELYMYDRETKSWILQD